MARNMFPTLLLMVSVITVSFGSLEATKYLEKEVDSKADSWKSDQRKNTSIIGVNSQADSWKTVQRKNTSIIGGNSQDACYVCDCWKDKTYGGVWVHCGFHFLNEVPKNFPDDTTMLQLHSNYLESVNENNFKNLKELKYLGFGHNRLNSLPKNLLYFLPKLKELYIDTNQLHSLPIDFFPKQLKLDYLYIYTNPLSCSCNLYRTLVHVIPGLKKDKWQGQKLGTCDENVPLMTMTPENEERFCGRPTTTPLPTTKALTTKSKDACDICTCKKDFSYDGTYVDCRSRHLTSVPKNIPETATTFNLFHNNVNSISFSDFSRLKNLRYLNIARNKLTTLPRQAFRSLHKLERLSLADNQLKSIEARSFDSLDQLKEAELYGNNLVSFPPYLFENQLRLKYLDVSDNELQCTCNLYHVLVKLVRNLGDHVSGTCGSGVDLSTITSDNKEKFCGKGR